MYRTWSEIGLHMAKALVPMFKPSNLIHYHISLEIHMHTHTRKKGLSIGKRGARLISHLTKCHLKFLLEITALGVRLRVANGDLFITQSRHRESFLLSVVVVSNDFRRPNEITSWNGGFRPCFFTRLSGLWQKDLISQPVKWISSIMRLR